MSEVTGAVLLRCGKCLQELSGLPDDTIFLCRNCRTAWVSGDSGLDRVGVSLWGEAGRESVFLPFWRVEADVTLHERTTRRRSARTPATAPREFDPLAERGLESRSGRRVLRSYLVPAVVTRRALSVGVGLRSNRPDLLPYEGPAPVMVGGSVDSADAVELSRAIAVGEEVAAADFLASLEIELHPMDVDLMGISCRASEKGFVIPGAGILLRYADTEDQAAILEYNGLSGG
jgi:hypothetical protein